MPTDIPLHAQRLRLEFVGVLLRCLNAQHQPIQGAFATGFIRREEEQLFLYTCWHVVTGYDPYDVRVGHQLPECRYLQVMLQGVKQPHPEVEGIGGLQAVELPLYGEGGLNGVPLWLQDDLHVPNTDLNAVGLFVPFWHDIVKIKLPEKVHVSDFQVIDEGRLFKPGQPLLSPGDKCVVVGYPYGFSAFGQAQPTPVALTRFAASSKILGRPQQFLLEAFGAPGMSGGPVYVEREENLYLIGIYTGLIYPDYEQGQNEKSTALGTVANLTLMLSGAIPLVQSPSKSATRPVTH